MPILCSNLEYRWYGQSEQMNSGVFFMKTGPDNFFLPKSIEVQLKKRECGRFVDAFQGHHEWRGQSQYQSGERIGRTLRKTGWRVE